MQPAVAPEIAYIALIFALFVLPRVLQRFRIPTAITSLAMGAIASIGFHFFAHDPTIQLLSTLGIVSLFLFAGLEVDVDDLRRGAGIILQHLAFLLAALVLMTVAAHLFLDLAPRPAALVALALLSPSTGFILSTLDSMGLDPNERFWIKAKAIASELLALATLFVTLQSTTVFRLSLSVAAMVAMILVLPLLFRAFAAAIVRHAPRSEFAFLLMVAVVCAYLTRGLGAYYLVGAFLVGMAAQRFREKLPSLASEELLRAVELFASFFVPFYFFHAGLELRREDFPPGAFLLGAIFIAVAVPLRIGMVVTHRRVALKETGRQGFRVAVSMIPTLVFTLVLAQILRDRFAAPPAVFGGLLVYTLVNTMLPSFLLRTPPVDYLEPHALELDAAGERGPAGARRVGPPASSRGLETGSSAAPPRADRSA